MKSKIFEGKNMEEILHAATTYFHQDSQQLDIKVIEQKKGLFGLGAKITAEVSLIIDPIKEGEKYLQQFLSDMAMTGDVEILHEGSRLCYNVKSSNNGFLIGKNGKGLQSLSVLTGQVVNMHAEKPFKVIVDVDSYRKKQVQRLERMAERIAREVVLTKIDAKLDPMNAFERRIIHHALSKWPEVKTVSTGEHPNRCLVIKCKK